MLSFECREPKLSVWQKQQHLRGLLIFPGALVPSIVHTLKSFHRVESKAFRNRHRYFSMNIQAISDGHLRIQNVVACWPGSTHDSTEFCNSPPNRVSEFL